MNSDEIFLLIILILLISITWRKRISELFLLIKDTGQETYFY